MDDSASLSTPPIDVAKVLQAKAPALLNSVSAARSGTVLVGLIGAGIQRSKSPIMHEREAAALNILLSYKLIDLNVLGLGTAALGDLIAWAESAGFAGLNITHPCKQAAVACVDALSEDAKAIGAINTIVFRDRIRMGHNTDCSGFGESFRREAGGFSKRNVVLLGAGGAGSAVARALLLNHVRALAVYDTDGVRAERLVAQLNEPFRMRRAAVATDLTAALATADGLVNATPLGTDMHPGIPIDVQFIRPNMWVADINYFRLETALLAEARKIGCMTIAGRGMAIFQAGHSFELFTGKKPDVERMERHFEASPRT
jgi:shikimate dehydrogenase